MQKHCRALCDLRTLSGVWRRLHRARIHGRRGRLSVTSPDPLYQEKLQDIQAALQEARADPSLCRVLYADEVRCFRQPFVRQGGHPAAAGGKRQKRAVLSHASNSASRFLATMDAWSGRVLFVGNSRITVPRIAAFLRQVV